MTQNEFHELVERLEAGAKTQPQAYKTRVVVLALVGYGYIALILLGLLLSSGLIILFLATKSAAFAGKLLIPLVVLTFYIFRSLWVKFPPPEGVSLTEQQSKPLIELASDLRRKLKAPRMHSILLTDDFNAGVVQVPRLGLFGWHKNYLMVGMPLMQALSLEQFRGVLAHELGHLSGKHGHLSSRIYRIRQTWAQLMTVLEERQHWGAAVFRGFLKWYVPLFSAYTFVLARAQEYEADRQAADDVGTRQFANALISIVVNGAFLDSSFWPGFYKKADTEPEPPASPFGEMANAFRSEVKPVQQGVWLAQAIDAKTGTEDTHPSLADRLAALGESASPPAPVTETAAQSLFASHEAELCSALAVQWREGVSASWRDRHRYAQEARARLNELEERTRSQSLTLDEEWDRACLTEEFVDPGSALPLYQHVLSLDENHLGASFAVGRLTIEDDSRAISLIERAMEQSHEYVIPGCELIRSYLVSKGRKEEAEQYYNRALNQSATYHAASEERSTVKATDQFKAHNLNHEQLQKLAGSLQIYRQVVSAYLACKRVKHLPEIPLYLLGIEPVSSWYKSISDEDATELSTRLANELELPGDFYILVFNKNNKEFKRALEKVPYSLIYDRQQ